MLWVSVCRMEAASEPTWTYSRRLTQSIRDCLCGAVKVMGSSVEMKNSFLPRMLFLAVLILALAGCAREEVHNEKILVFGTIVDVSVRTDDARLAGRGFEVVRAELERLHAAWRPQGEGELGAINRAFAAGEAAPVSDELAALIVEATALSRQSGGRFNPAIGGLVALWGFGADDPPQGPPPDAAGIEALVALRPSMDDLEIRQGSLKTANTAVQLDFGAFAKGYAVDLAIGRLRALGIEDAIVNAGGDLRAVGGRGDRPWRIGIRDPRGPGVLASVEIDGDESVFTSGDYERAYEYGGRRYHHILDPFTGLPAAGLTSVTVIHPRAALADAAATAIFVAGPEEWAAAARALGVELVMVVDDAGTLRMTPRMEKRLHFEQDVPRIVLEELP